MFGLLKSVVDLAANAVEIVAAPVEMVADLANAALQPMAEAARELKDDIKSIAD